jgi:predicted CoA-binding protein
MNFPCKVQDTPATDADLKCILSNAKTVVVVGLTPKEDSPSNEVAQYLLEQGFRIFPVNPNCDEVLGQKCYPDLKSIPEHVDVVEIFRKPDVIPAIVDEAVKIGAGTVWMQLDLEHEEAAQTARNAGLNVVMNRCMKMESTRLFGKEEKSPSSMVDKEKSAEDRQVGLN